jgi:hypothetical protein
VPEIPPSSGQFAFTCNNNVGTPQENLQPPVQVQADLPIVPLTVPPTVPLMVPPTAPPTFKVLFHGTPLQSADFNVFGATPTPQLTSASDRNTEVGAATQGTTDGSTDGSYISGGSIAATPFVQTGIQSNTTFVEITIFRGRYGC